MDNGTNTELVTVTDIMAAVALWVRQVAAAGNKLQSLDRHLQISVSMVWVFWCCMKLPQNPLRRKLSVYGPKVSDRNICRPACHDAT